MKTLHLPPVWALTGPTASGKSQLALAAARDLELELVCADSVQLVRGFDIGSAKPSAQERTQVVHHLVDMTDWRSPWDASLWANAAKRVLEDAKERSQGCLLVGGTGLYLRALRCGLIDVPRDAGLREQLLAQERALPGALYRQLSALDAESAQSLSPNNVAHVLRALEATLLIGSPVSRLRQAHRASAEGGFPLRLIALDRPDDVLKQRLLQRSYAMLQEGLIEEVRALLAEGADPECQPMRAIGYREVARALRQKKDVSEQALAHEIARASWQYVRRQRTWLRREERDAHVVRLLWREETAHEMKARLKEILTASRSV